MEMFFSAQAQDLGGIKNPLYLLHDEMRAKGRRIIDLVRGSVNEHGIVFPADTLRSVLDTACQEARLYRPDSFGQRSARRTIAKYYGGLGLVDDHIVITPGTSVSYWYAFKLFAEPGDEILCPRPSYPLFDYIARLCDVKLTTYQLLEAQDWSIDMEELESQITRRTRAIVLISPHNPTGMVADQTQLEGLAEIALRHQLPIISDEVFSEFVAGNDRLPRPAETSAPLVLTLNGLSKMFALPGMKIGWMAITGAEDLVRKTLSALEMISDTFLPVNEIAQFAVPGIFEQGQDFLQHYRTWVQSCRTAALAALPAGAFVVPRGGFYVTLRIDGDEDEAAARLLEEDEILVHPGYFYDIDGNHLVMTFIEDPATVGETFSRIGRFA
jgi:alanine-synthesizing transaminase